MNIYPVFDLPIEYPFSFKNGEDYSYTLFTKTSVYRAVNSMLSYAAMGDILVGSNRKRFWTRGAGMWHEHPFDELPEEYKAWLVLVG